MGEARSLAALKLSHSCECLGYVVPSGRTLGPWPAGCSMIRGALLLGGNPLCACGDDLSVFTESRKGEHLVI